MHSINNSLTKPNEIGVYMQNEGLEYLEYNVVYLLKNDVNIISIQILQIRSCVHFGRIHQG